MKRAEWTQAEMNFAMRAYAHGNTYQQIADAMSRTKDGVADKLRKLTNPERYYAPKPTVEGAWTDDDTQTAIELRDYGLSYTEVAKRMGRTKGSVIGRLHRLEGLGLRPRELNSRQSDPAFCDALADGASVAEAGRIVGISKRPAMRKFRRICLELGDQAI